MLRRHESLAILLLAGGMVCAPGDMSAGERDKKAPQVLQQALQSEASGDVTQRDALLEKLLADDPDFAPARWQAGFVGGDGGWQGLPREGSLSQPDVLREYRKIRETFPATAKGQLDLANWCSHHRLRDQERAHLTAVLALSGNANDAAIQSRMGHELVDGRWLTRDEIRGLQHEAKDIERTFEHWRPVLQRIATGLADRSRSVREVQRKALLAITDPDALPAMEAVLCQRDAETARLLCDAYAGMKTHKAGVALARQAVYSPYESVRTYAGRLLASRMPEEYAAGLLAQLSTPIESKASIYVGKAGVQLMRALYRETQDFRELAVLDTRFNFVQVPLRLVPQADDRLVRLLRRQATSDASVQSELMARSQSRQIDIQNEEAVRLTDRALAALSLATHITLPKEPELWWQWWVDYNDLYAQDEKPLKYDYTTDETTESVPVILVPPCSCLVAGTLVWTDRGAVPVESVRIGDLALSKHPETGELTYKPVVRTTLRPARSLFKVQAGGSSFVATGGHTFWISGRGWMKVRDVEPGMRFHGATGPVTIEAIEPQAETAAHTGEQSVYNLIVADFHTYFVGKSLVLSHDPTFAEPTDVHIPGLVAAK